MGLPHAEDALTVQKGKRVALRTSPLLEFAGISPSHAIAGVAGLFPASSHQTPAL